MRRQRFFGPESHKMSEAQREGLSGPVKHVMCTTYKAHLRDGEAVQGKIETDTLGTDTNYIVEFNKDGGIVYEETFGSGSREINTYDGNARRLKSVKYYSGRLHAVTTYTYNEFNRYTQVESVDADGNRMSLHTYTYTDIGQSLEDCFYYGKDNELRSRTVREYMPEIFITNGQKHRKQTSVITYNGDGTVDHSSTYKYDEHGNEIEHKWIYTEEKQRKYNRHHTRKYNEHGDCIEYTTYNNDGSVKDTSIYTYEYDAEGKRIVKPHAPYDPYELKPGESEEFEKDQHGNWIKRTFFYNKKPLSIMVREITYHDDGSEKEQAMVHPLMLVPEEETEDTSKQIEELKPKQAKWIAEGMGNNGDFPLHRYYAMMYNEVASVVNFSVPYVEVFALREMLTDEYEAQTVHSHGVVWNGYKEKPNRYTLTFPDYPGYLLHVSNIHEQHEDEYEVPSYIEDLGLWDGEHIHFGQVQLLRPCDSSAKREEWFEEKILEMVGDCAVDRKPEKPYINIIETTANGFTMKEHPVDDEFEIRDLDVNYGYGFSKFHEELMGRFRNSTKGLVLFHGQPGTGKTYYIRHLLRSMVTNKKVVIYMPPNMVDHLVEPGFMTFLAEEVRNWSAEGNFCVLLIEDAEPLLAKRQEGVRIQGITNLLNLSDGILNDMLNLQIICTFNVDVKKLDSALLRPGRLIARKEFKALDELDANLLAQRLGIRHHFTKPATLGEIYAMRKNQNTLIHDVTSDRNSSTLIDDLL